MFLNVWKVLGVVVALSLCCTGTVASTLVFNQNVDLPGNAASHRQVDAYSMPGSMRQILQEALPLPIVKTYVRQPQSSPKRSATTDDQRQHFLQASLSSTPREKSQRENLMSWGAIPYLEIEVRHGEHTFTLFSHAEDGNKKVLYHCRVGLGGPEFPTPVGTYYVTHIYDDQPWWIPPKDRAWAAGEKPSKKVYGGTMAPLLKKRDIREKKRTPSSEDMIAGKVKLEDYGYRFHGTNSPRSIGRNQSHGCVRMLPEDAKKVAELIKEHVGTKDRRESENGSYVVLKSPVRLNLVK